MARRALVLGIGGGGDAASAIVVKKYLERMGYDVILGAVIWERFVVDPIPGPICAEDLTNYKPYSRSLYWVNGNTEAVRGEKARALVPQLSRVLKVLGEKGLGVCVRWAPQSLAEELRQFAEDYRVEKIVGVDAGGDVLAKGCEPTLGSPLIDFAMLLTLEDLERDLNVELAVMGLGSDGELDPDYLLERVSEVASKGGLTDIKGYDEESYRTVGKVLELAETEASKLPWLAFKGFYGPYTLRGGLRKVNVSPMMAIAFFMKPSVVGSTSPLYQALKGSKELEEVRKRMNELGIFTEYDLEIELFRLTNYGRRKANWDDVVKAREIGRNRLGPLKLKCAD